MELLVKDRDRLLASGAKRGRARLHARATVPHFDGSVSAPYTAAWLLYRSEWLSGEVMRWIIETKTTSFVGSTQNQVPAAPSQKNVPLPSGSSASGGSKITATLNP